MATWQEQSQGCLLEGYVLNVVGNLLHCQTGCFPLLLHAAVSRLRLQYTAAHMLGSADQADHCVLKLVTRVQHAHAAPSRCLEAGEALGAGGAHGDDPEHVEPDGLGQGPGGQGSTQSAAVATSVLEGTVLRAAQCQQLRSL